MVEKIFLDYTQDELDRAYDPRAWSPNGLLVLSRCKQLGERLRQRLKYAVDVPYGPTADEVLDIFLPTAARDAGTAVEQSPIHVFIHGGGWLRGTKNDASLLAQTFVDAGAIYIALNFANLPTVSLSGMVDQLRRAIVWVYKNAANFGGDRSRIHVSGHSSGAHLAALLLVAESQNVGGAGCYIIRTFGIRIFGQNRWLPKNAMYFGLLMGKAPWRGAFRFRKPVGRPDRTCL
jgi:arylformamidase